jgi:hypothetical protein
MARILIVEDDGQARAPSPKSILKAAKYGTLSARTVTEAMVGLRVLYTKLNYERGVTNGMLASVCAAE